MKIRHLSLLLVLALAGCSRDKVRGVSLSLGKFERGLWYDHDKQQYDENGFGVKFDIVSGHMLRPFKKPFSAENPWKGGKDAGVLRLPFIGPFLSVAIGPYGFYFGSGRKRCRRKARRTSICAHRRRFGEPGGSDPVILR